MKIFLAGENGKKRLIRKLADVNIFSGGETRHWLHDPLLESEKENATVSCGRVSRKHGERNQADLYGGIVPEVINESVPCKSTHDSEIPKRATNGDFPIRGGYT